MRQFSRVLSLSFCLVAISASAASSQATATARQSRTQAILASFTKKKHVVKEKYGVRREKYKDVQSEAVVRANPVAYSGTYQVAGDWGFVLRLNVDANGRVTGTGEDPMPSNSHVLRRFTLADARIDGALLTATKVYGSGRTERLDGVFMNLTTFESPTDKGVTVFGLGAMVDPVHVDGLTLDKLFYELRR